MQIFDTLGNKKTELEFSDKVRIYLCGVTVYDDAHIGHARTIIVFDVLRRFLESQNIPVEFIQNFTDVDDKIIDRAQQEKISPLELAAKYTKNYVDDFEENKNKRFAKTIDIIYKKWLPYNDPPQWITFKKIDYF